MIYSRDGYIVTNNHVVEFADDIEVILEGGKNIKQKSRHRSPNRSGRPKNRGTDLPTLGFANSDILKVGEWVLAVGNPFGYFNLNSDSRNC